MYTHVMPITTTNSFALVTLQRLVVDCAMVNEKPEADQDLSRLITWMKTQPRTSQMHVMLRSATSNPTGRKLKSVFQSLGCTVSMLTRL